MSKRKFLVSEVVSLVASNQADEDDDSDMGEYSRLQEALDEMAGSSKDVGIIILPPSTTNAISDEEVMDEDDLQPSDLLHDVSGRVALHIHNNDNDDTDVEGRAHTPALKGKKLVDVPIQKWGKKVQYDKLLPEVSPEQIFAVKWHDNKCVTMATYYNTVEPLGKPNTGLG